MKLSDFHYQLPERLIAQFPAEQRRGSRLLVLRGGDGDAPFSCRDLMFTDLPGLLNPGDILVFNDTKVLAARMHGQKSTGGKVEIMLERVVAPAVALAHLKASKPSSPGTVIILGDSRLRVRGRQDDLFELDALDKDFFALMAEHGHMPLPPYIRREDEGFDESRYQTVYAEKPGAVAAPTAGLHFDQAMLDELAQKGVKTARVTLHVGAGTFQPVRTQNLDEHQMHSEWLEVGEDAVLAIQEARNAGGRVVAVGTTSVRCLETASADGSLKPFRGETRLFIRPGYQFQSVDAMLTNFHLPESTLLMLVSAFVGYDQTMAAYAHAVASDYRFFSYGDAMLIEAEKKRG